MEEKMGVQYMNIFTRKYAQEIYQRIQITEEIKKWIREHNGEQPNIIIDLYSLSRALFKNYKELLCGGRHQCYLNRIEQFFHDLWEAGAVLVFFVNGQVQEHNFEAWKKIQKDRYRFSEDILNKINSNIPVQKIVDQPEIINHEFNWDLFANNNSNYYYNYNYRNYNNDYEHTNRNAINLINNNTPMPNEIKIIIPFLNSVISGLLLIAKKYGKSLMAIKNDFHYEIAEYATYHNAMAVILNNSDFLIYKGNWQFWSAKDVIFESMETILLNRQLLCNKLQLTQEQMPLFAILCGTEKLPIEKLYNFHKRMAIGIPCLEYKFKKIAQYVKMSLYNVSNLFNLSTKKLQKIAQDALGSSNLTNVNIIQDALNFYKLNLNGSIYDLELLEHYDSVIFSFIQNDSFNLTIAPYSDLRSTDLKPYFELMIPMLSRQMGVLLKHKNDLSLRRTIGINPENGNYIKITVLPEYPLDDNVPALKEFCNVHNTNLDDLRWKLLCWMISDNLNPITVKEYPPVWMINILVAYFLVEKGQISIEEADGFLLTVQANNSGLLMDVTDVYPQILNERLFRVCFLFGDVYTHILRCVQIVGLKDYLLPLHLDGVHFHKVMQEICSSMFLYRLAIDPIDYYRLYDEIKN